MQVFFGFAQLENVFITIVCVINIHKFKEKAVAILSLHIYSQLFVQ